jgi:RNA polymerase primary sigma factor
MISLGKDRGFLTFSEIIDHLQENIIDPEAFENIIKTLEELGINIKQD